MRKLSLFISLSLLLAISACESEDPLREATGLMQDNSNTAGCGWLINVNGAFFQPRYLPSQYRVEALEVFFTFEPLEEDLGCQLANAPVQAIRLIQIKPG